MAIKKPLVNYNGQLKELQSGDTLSGSSSTVTEIEIDFGSKPISSKRFSIADALAFPTSKIIVVGSGNIATGGTEDDWEWDNVQFVAKSNTGDFTIFAYSNTLIGGKRKIFYTIN